MSLKFYNGIFMYFRTLISHEYHNMIEFFVNVISSASESFVILSIVCFLFLCNIATILRNQIKLYSL